MRWAVGRDSLSESCHCDRVPVCIPKKLALANETADAPRYILERSEYAQVVC